MKRVALYARVSHVGEDQDPEAQLSPLREFAAARNWRIVAEYTDRAPAGHPTMRTSWAQLRGDAQRRRFDVVLVWKLDRAFRSTLAAELELSRFDRLGIAFACATQPIDTTESIGRLMFTFLAAFAQLERTLISERTKAGLQRARDRARLEGRELGKPGRPRGRKDRRKRRRRTKAELAVAASSSSLGSVRWFDDVA